MLPKVFMISKNHLYDDKTTLQTAPTIQLNISIQFAYKNFMRPEILAHSTRLVSSIVSIIKYS